MHYKDLSYNKQKSLATDATHVTTEDAIHDLLDAAGMLEDGLHKVLRRKNSRSELESSLIE